MTPPRHKLSYQNLRVYRDLIEFIAIAEEHVSTWDGVHAVVNHFHRASESSLVCLAEACRDHQLAAKNQALDCCAGSVLECAGCVDIAECKALCTLQQRNNLKQKLVSVFRQLVALRNSWQRPAIQEDSPDYGNDCAFNHEQLKVYQLALEVNRLLADLRLLDRLPRADFRRMDEPAASIALNIAEGNGRFAHLDHSRFLEIANQANTKLAARIEICVLRGNMEKAAATEIGELLVRIDRMTGHLAEVWKEKGC